jgi:hypothetical protein
MIPKNKLMPCLVVVLLFFVSKAAAQSYDYKENAVYIYNFIKYTNWPVKKAVLEVGVIGNTPVGEELKGLLARKKGAGISYNIKKANIDQLSRYDVIIISKDASQSVKQITQLTKSLPILIITEKANMGKEGACISFFINEDEEYKTEYQLSMKNCKERGLTITEQIRINAELMR